MDRERFPGLNDWIRFDGPAGTQPVDTAIDAGAAWMRSGSTANVHGPFPQATLSGTAVALARASSAELLGGER